MRPAAPVSALLLALLLAACGSDSDPGGLSASDARALNEAAAATDLNAALADPDTPDEGEQP